MRHRYLIAAAVALAAAAAPASASAQSQGFKQSNFTLKSSKGYKITVYGASTGSKITMTVAKGITAGDSATYSTDGTNRTTKLKASFGAVGKLDVEFQPRKTRVYKIPKGCTAKKGTAITTGTWEGKITFKGENGYSKVTARRAKGTVQNHPAMTCKPPEQQSRTEVHLGAVGWDTDDTPGFGFTAVWHGSKVHYSAHTSEQRGAVFIARSAYGRASSGFTRAADLSSASVSLGSGPVRGSATYTADPEMGENAGTFLGSLTARFPGRADPMALTGPDVLGTLDAITFG